MRFFIVFWGILLCLFPRTAFSEPDSPGKGDLLGFGVGAVNIRDSNKSGAFRVEYLSDKRLWKLVPFTGLIMTTETAVYSYAGLGLEFCITPQWMIIPRLNAGLFYSFAGQSLGSPIEFYSNLEVAYRFKDRSRLGLTVGHISNARIGSQNPGIETLFLAYTVPIHCFCGQ